MAGIIDDLPGRLDQVEQRLTEIQTTIADLPDYGRGVIDGVQMRADAIGGQD